MRGNLSEEDDCCNEGYSGYSDYWVRRLAVARTSDSLDSLPDDPPGDGYALNAAVGPLKMEHRPHLPSCSHCLCRSAGSEVDEDEGVSGGSVYNLERVVGDEGCEDEEGYEDCGSHGCGHLSC